AGAAPLVTLLGFDPPDALEVLDEATAATIRGGGGPVALLVTGWGVSFDMMWRTAVAQAARRGAAWCLLFDGMRLRIVDADRVYARRYLEFDLDVTLAD